MSPKPGSPRHHLLEIKLARQNWKCGLCGLTIEETVQANLDHIVPRALGGSNRASNLQAAHIECNSAKGSGRMDLLWEVEIERRRAMRGQPSRRKGRRVILPKDPLLLWVWDHGQKKWVRADD